MRLAKMAPNGAMAPWLVLLGVAGYAWCSGPCSSSGRTFQRGWTTCMADTVLHKLQLQPDPEAVRRGLRSALCLVRTEAGLGADLLLEPFCGRRYNQKKARCTIWEAPADLFACALLVSQSRQEVGPLFPCSSSFSQASWTAPAENQAAAELELRRVAAISSEAFAAEPR
ncbi:unnamed protein product [Effrenium voratum]|uniref:Uncharacterized protein n=1 Tax=Effrenium voratum TaxID=2562239 RepID=A0AA36JA64_9DINO|nr:unnamed protein product [Effrenium voratum]CAJ1429108.1 unnamed protein product [Effrenium voratum]